ncbi:teichoic acid biosynthesis protein [Myxococcota bacterium]|nr:teichoic acid biosynthesis protein [Myxococcota bacterium]
MRILYGVVGEGMGHATRSRVVLEHLLAQGHELHVVVSGRAFGFLRQAFAARAGDGPGTVDVQEIVGLHLVYEGGAVDKSESLWSNLGQAPEGIQHNLQVYEQVVGSFQPDAVVSDFESWAYLFGRAHDIPVVSIDNMQVINRCRHDLDVVTGPSGLPALDFRLAKLSVKVKLPGAFHYLVSTFFTPPVRKPRTTLVPPILRPEILAARREPGAHLLVYQTASTNRALLQTLSRLPMECRVYGMGTERDPGLGDHVRLCAFSQQGFVDDLRTARAVVAGGGYSLMGEAVHLGVPMLSVPLKSQFEQELNARYLARLGYGAWAPELTEAALRDFLARVDEHAAALRGWTPRDNRMLFACLDEVLARVDAGEAPPEALSAENLGDIVSARTAQALGE